MNIYIGNLSRDVTDDDLKDVFKDFGQIASVNVIKDRYSGESRGFGFVDMPSRDEARSAIGALNGTELKGLNISVNEARPRPENRGGRGNKGRGYGGGQRY